MAVSSNSTAMSARKSMDRRTLLRGAVAVPAVALVPAAAPAQTQTDTARRVHALASEISSLLTELDDGRWEVRVSPLFRGAPSFSVEPGERVGVAPARDILERYYVFLWRELAELSKEMDVEMCSYGVLLGAGGHKAYLARYGHAAPSTRAGRVLQASAGRKTL